MKNQILPGLISCLLLLIASPAYSQNSGGGPSADQAAMTVRSSIYGVIMDGDSGSPLDYATISLYTLNNELVTGTITTADGSFNLEAQPGTYYALIEFLGYENQRIDDIQLGSNNRLDLGIINIGTSTAQLDEVTVTAERSTMQLSLDKRVFHVGSDLGSRGGNASDLLDNVPSVQVDVEGNVSLRGSGNVRILINGRPSNLLGSDGSGLQQLPAASIDRIELVTNPGARYEAEGTAGIINIILKEDRARGLNGSFDLTAGLPEQYGASVNLNRRAQKLNFFTNIGLQSRFSPGDGSVYTEVYNDDLTLISSQRNERERQSLGLNLRFGADYFFNPRNTLTTAFSYRLGDDDNLNTTFYNDFENTFNNPTGSEIRVDEEIEDDKRLQYSLNYKLTFPETEGRQLTADISYQDNSETESSDLNNRFFNATGNPAEREDLFQRSANTESNTQLVFQTDYVHPFGKDNKLEAGLRASIRNIDNDFLVEELENSTNIWTALEGLTNVFAYEEKVYAAYLTYGNRYGLFSYQVGLRPEYSDISTQLLQTDEVNQRDYLNLFPSAFLNYELPGENSIQLSFSRRISRPRFWDLNPFFTFTDNRNFFSGNPNLNPEFTNSFELGHLKYFERGSVSSSLYFRHTDDVVVRLRDVDEMGNSTTRPENLATEDAYGLEVTFNYEITKWWRLSSDLNFFGFDLAGRALEQDLSAEGFTWFARGTSRFELNDKFDTQIRFFYRAATNDPQGRRSSMSGVNLAGSHKIWKDKGTLTLSVRDVFNSRRRRYTTRTDGFFLESESQYRRGPQISLTLAYRLNEEKRRGQGGRGSGDFEGGGEF